MFLTHTKTKTHLSVAMFQKTMAIVFLSTTVLFVTSVLFMAGYSMAYEDKVMPNIYAGQVLLGGKEVNAVESEILNAANDFDLQNGIVLSYGAEKYYPSLVDLGIEIDVNQTARQAATYGRDSEDVNRFFEMVNSAVSDKMIPLAMSIDQNVLEQYIKSNLAQLEVPVQDAYINFDSGEPRPMPAKEGLVVDSKTLTQKVVQAVSYLEPAKIDLQTITAYPDVDYQEAWELSQVAEGIIAEPIILSYQDYAFKIESEEIASWLISVKDPETSKLDLSIKESALSNTLDMIGQDFENTPQSKIIIAARDNTTIIQEGAEGQITDRTQAADDIAQVLFASKNRSVELALVNADPPEQHEYVPAAPSNDGKVVAVNLTRQRAYAFENGELIFATKVSTGRAGHGTPPGKFHIYGKDRSAKMSGADYYLPGVPYIMWYSGDYSLHGTYWHDNFGHVMSHGCSNFPTPSAEWVFNWAPLRTPVYIANEVDGVLVY